MKRIIAKGIAHTDGSGIWSKAMKSVPVILEVADGEIVEWLEPDAPPFYGGHLHACFAKKDWSTKRLGLIYTDKRFLNDVRALLARKGFKRVDHVVYSEQGMQGRDYVDFDISDLLAKEFIAKGYAKKVVEDMMLRMAAPQ